MSNPLLNIQFNELPNYSAVLPEHVEPAIDSAIEKNKKSLNALLESDKAYTWENLVLPIEVMDAELSDLSSAISYLNAVKNTPELYKAYQNISAKLSLYYTEVGHNEVLYKAYLSIRDSEKYLSLNLSQKKVIENILKDFELSGINLSEAKKAEFKEISLKLTDLEDQFEQNVLESTDAWFLLVSDMGKLKGLPENALKLASALAKEKSKEGWLLTLDYPSYHAVMTYAEDRELRRQLYHAYCTRASLQFPAGEKWDNSELMLNIMNNRQRLAELLGFKEYSEYVLTKRMLKTRGSVLGFLDELLLRSKKVALAEVEALKAFAKQHCQINTLEVWDTAYVSEKMRHNLYDVSEEVLRQYFPEDTVLTGLFKIVNKLYDITIKEVLSFESWHESVRFFEVYDAQDQLRGRFFLDLYARPAKQGGAWVSTCKVRLKNQEGQLQKPVTYLTCNFSKSANNLPALLSHDEVITLFHEFGHCLHNILTLVDYPSISGMNGVYWDAVELPSQLLENWCWEKEALSLISRHFENNTPIPQELFEKLEASKNFQAGLFLVRQLEFALFDFKLHNLEKIESSDQIQKLLDEVRHKAAVLLPPEFNRFQHGFTHIFSGGYAAGYYSYLWSEVMSLDTFEFFKESGKVFDKDVARKFMSVILEQGGSKDFMELFLSFRGRPPKIDALLKHYNLQ